MPFDTVIDGWSGATSTDFMFFGFEAALAVLIAAIGGVSALVARASARFGRLRFELDGALTRTVETARALASDALPESVAGRDNPETIRANHYFDFLYEQLRDTISAHGAQLSKNQTDKLHRFEQAVADLQSALKTYRRRGVKFSAAYVQFINAAHAAYRSIGRSTPSRRAWLKDIPAQIREKAETNEAGFDF